MHSNFTTKLDAPHRIILLILRFLYCNITVTPLRSATGERFRSGGFRRSKGLYQRGIHAGPAVSVGAGAGGWS